MTITQSLIDGAVTQILTDFDTNITHNAVGSDATLPVVGDTTLGTETYREAFFSKLITTNNHRTKMRLDITENNGNTQEEIGLFNAASGGTMYVRNNVTSFAKTALNEAVYRIDNTFNVLSGD